MISTISIYVGGVLTLLMAIFHIRFPKIFQWGKDYGRITEKNKRIFHTIHLALLLLFVVIGVLSLLYAHELSERTAQLPSELAAAGFLVLHNDTTVSANSKYKSDIKKTKV